MSHRLTPASSKPAPMLSLRLPEDLQAALVGVKDALARATPGLEPSLSDAVRVLLREALAARAAQAAGAHEAEGRRVVREGHTPRQRAREQLRAGPVTHTAADGQLSLLTRTANDTRAIDADELRLRLVATGASTRVIAAATGLGKSAVAKFMGGGPAGATVLAALDGFVSQAQP